MNLHKNPQTINDIKEDKVCFKIIKRGKIVVCITSDLVITNVVFFLPSQTNVAKATFIVARPDIC